MARLTTHFLNVRYLSYSDTDFVKYSLWKCIII
jgi:hypothetical protein